MGLPRDKTGRFIPKDVNGVAIYTSIGPGMCNMRNLTITMDPAMFGEKKGKRIEIRNGIYKTSDAQEIAFLDWKEKHPKPFSAIKCVQRLVNEEEAS
jgi:hypothetical protein